MRASALATLPLFLACSGVAVIDGVASGGGAQPSTSSGGITSASSSSGAGGFDACSGPGQCALTFPGCCHSCDLPSLDTLVPVAQSQADAFHAQQCPRPEDCDQCEACPNGNLLALCNNDRCSGVDLREHSLSECPTSDQCILRAGTDCCESCAELDVSCGGLVAINAAALTELNGLVCPGDGAACPPCAPSFPDNAVSECLDGHCQVMILE